jgi:hypothetical protein
MQAMLCCAVGFYPQIFLLPLAWKSSKQGKKDPQIFSQIRVCSRNALNSLSITSQPRKSLNMTIILATSKCTILSIAGKEQ